MPPRAPTVGAKKVVSTPRLPAMVPKLHIRQPNSQQPNPCIGIMSSVLGCWASSGHAAAGCAALEQQLRACMDAPRPPNPPKDIINFHLTRFYPQIIGPRKKKRGTGK